MGRSGGRTGRRGIALGAAGVGVGASLAARRRRTRERAVGLSGVIVERSLGPVALVVNPGSGSAAAVDDEADGVRVRELAEGEDLREVLSALLDEGVGVLGVAGGDGSVGCAAGVALARGATLWAVPGGTLNHFTRDLGLGDAAAARAGLAAGRVARVDVCEAGGTVVVNNASLGVYGVLVRRRERLERRMPKRVALLVATARTLRDAPAIDLILDGERRRAYLLFVGNNRYEGTGLTARASLQEGVLDVRLLSAEGRLPRLAALWAIARAGRGGSRWLQGSIRTELRVQLETPAALAHDGEVAGDVEGELIFRSRPGALRVIAPPA